LGTETAKPDRRPLGEDSEKFANGRFSEMINGRWLEEEGILAAGSQAAV
jgi:hypothetical protein